jgi:DNA-binding GntR family transcriptional regulator
VSIGSDDARIDDAARRELDAEAERHSKAVGGLTTRDAEAAAAEADRHIERVREIMRDLVRRSLPT